LTAEFAVCDAIADHWCDRQHFGPAVWQHSGPG
jgi:hypothetical protein